MRPKAAFDSNCLHLLAIWILEKTFLQIRIAWHRSFGGDTGIEQVRVFLDELLLAFNTANRALQIVQGSFKTIQWRPTCRVERVDRIVVPAGQRERLERVCRQALRPPLSQEGSSNAGLVRPETRRARPRRRRAFRPKSKPMRGRLASAHVGLELQLRRETHRARLENV
jgi:hypothetical protein